MKNLKLTISTLALTLAVNLSMAQGSIEQRATAQTEKLTTELQLSADQKSKVHDIHVGIMSKNDAIRNDSNMPEATKKESINGNNEAYHSYMKEILTPQQYIKFQELEAGKKVSNTQPVKMNTGNTPAKDQQPKKIEKAK